MSPLRPTDVPVRDPAAQAVALPDGRLLVRHRRGLSLLAGVGPEEVAPLLERMDGRRTAAEVAAGAAADRGADPERAVSLLRSLAGELFEVSGGGEPGAEGRPAIEAATEPAGGEPSSAAARAPIDSPIESLELLVSGAGGEALAATLRRVHGAGVSSYRVDPRAPAPPEELAPGARRVVALEGAAYGDLLELQEALRRRGLDVLFVTPDPDGVRVGPAVAAAGGGPCLGCSLLAALAPTGLPAGEALAAARHLRTVGLDALTARAARPGLGIGGPPADLVRRLAAVVAREAAGPDRSLGGVVLVPAEPGGAERRLPTPRRGDCPVCAGATGAGVVREGTDPASGPVVRSTFHVGILGAGTAGCLAALGLRAKRPEVRVTILRSPDIPTIGVGEATTPLMPQFLHADLGVGAAELFREVRPTFKLGIRFDWGSPPTRRTGGFPYPFGPVRPLEAVTWDGGLDACSRWAVLMAAGVLPVTAEEDGRLAARFGTEVAYHLDNRRLADYLERLCRLRGVEIVDARVVAVERDEAGGEPRVTALVGEDGRRFAFDLHVDCSGFRSFLLGEALGSPFVGYGASLFTDRAVVGSVARAEAREGAAPLPPFTRATARAAGWSWSIPQPEADHVGSVYSSAFAGADEAARELEAALGAPVEGLRELRFRSGRREHFWRGNVVALGNAYGFVEPLESTALHLLIRQIGLLVRHLPADPREAVETASLDRRVGTFWDYVGWFLAIHFRFNRRLDTPFWRACREDADVSAHGELIERFREGGPLTSRGGEGGFDYPDPLWGPEGIDVLLLGQGVACPRPAPELSEAAWRAESEGRRRLARRCLAQGEVLARLPERPEVLAALEDGFKDHGPAF